MPSCVWVTRPASSANALAALFEQQGVHTHVEPLMRICALQDDSLLAHYRQAMAQFEQIDLCIFISANAVEHWLRLATHAELESIRQKQVFAVGRATQAALAVANIEAQAPQTDSSSEALLALDALQHVEGKRCYIFRGVGGRGYLQQQLVARGSRADHIELYERLPPAVLSAKLQTLLAEQQLSAVLVGSAETFENLLRCIPDFSTNIPLIVPSERVAKAIARKGDYSVVISPSAVNDDMVATTLNTLNLERSEPLVSISATDNTSPEQPPEPAILPPVSESEGDDKPTLEPTSEATSSASATTPVAQPKKGGRLAVLFAVFALLLALVAAAGAGWLWYIQQPLNALLDQQFETTQRQQHHIAALQQQHEATLNAFDTAEQARKALAQQALKIQRDNWQLQQQINDLVVTDRGDWQLAEIEYLLRLAHQRLMVGREVAPALALMQQADQRLADLNRADLWSVREQVAADINALQLANDVDRTGIYLEIQALLVQAETIQLANTQAQALVVKANREDTSTATDATALSWREMLGQAWQDIVGLYNVRRREHAVQPLLSEEQRWLVHQRLTLHLTQAQQALISADDSMFRTSLNNAKQLLQTYAVSGKASSRFVDMIEAIALKPVSQALPDISGSHTVLTEYLKVYRATPEAPSEQ